MQRASDKNFDKFELYALKNILSVPADLQQEVDAGATADGGLDEKTEALWAQLQQSLATRRELQRRVASAANSHALCSSQMCSQW